MRYTLAIETSHAQGSVAIAAIGDTAERAGDSEIDVVRFSAGLVHGRELLPAIAEIFGRRGLAPAALGCVAVSSGPGSYTGIRIGVSAAKALAWSQHIPAIGISSLEAIAHAATGDARDPATLADGDVIAVIVDARRGACYLSSFRLAMPSVGSRTLTRLTDDRVIDVSAGLASLPPDCWLVGSGARTLPGVDVFRRLPATSDAPDAAATLAIADRIARDIENATREAPPEWSDPHALLPVYLRPSEAEEKRAARDR